LFKKNTNTKELFQEFFKSLKIKAIKNRALISADTQSNLNAMIPKHAQAVN